MYLLWIELSRVGTMFNFMTEKAIKEAGKVIEKPLVQMIQIKKTFSGIPANDCVDFTLKEGSVHGLLGENGAGKTTLMNILFGLYEPDSGKVLIKGEPVKIHSPLDAMNLKIGMVHQHFMLVKTLTVTENIMLGIKSTRTPFLDTRMIRNRIIELSGKYGLDIDPDAKIWQLSVGQQQRVEILTAIFKGADILILDEPTAVLTPGESEDLFSILRELRNSGIGIILISHKLEEILAIADEVTILRNGVKTGETLVTPSTTKQELTRMMVGRDVLFNFTGKDVNIGKECLSLDHLCAIDDRGVQVLQDVSFSIKDGEILGLAGVDGNGQKELCQILTGLRKTTGGTIHLYDQDLLTMTPKQCIDNKIFHIPEDRQKSGLIMDWDVQKNLILKNYDSKSISGRFCLSEQRIGEQADTMIQEYNIKTPGREEVVKKLSGGNQQKIILAREMEGDPELLIASHPTRGLDIGAMEYVRQRILDQKANGAAILLVSADLEEIFQLSDRIAVIYNGRIMGIVSPDAGISKIGMLMAGIMETENVGVDA